MSPRTQHHLVRRAQAALALSLLLSLGPARAETTVPLELQVELLQKVLRFEKGLAARGHGELNLAVVARSGNSKSQKAGAQLASELEKLEALAGLKLKVSVVAFSSAAALKDAAQGQSFQVLYLAPGFEQELPAIAGALAGVPVITLTTDGDQVDVGAVLGFELFSAKPRIVLNQGQAKKQGLDFGAELPKLARVVK